MIVKNILNNLRRFATSTLLNVVGLSVAFASAFVLLVQVDYDFSYNDGIPDAERIYRIDTPFWGGIADYQAIISYPHARGIAEKTSGVETWAVAARWMSPKTCILLDGKNAGSLDDLTGIISFSSLMVSPSIDSLLSMKIVDGDFRRMVEPNTVALSRSWAEKYEVELGHRLYTSDTSEVVAIYEDFPKDCDFGGVEMLSMFNLPDFYNAKGEWSFSFYCKLQSEEHSESLLRSMYHFQYELLYDKHPDPPTFEEFITQWNEEEMPPRVVPLSESYFHPAMYYFGKSGNKLFTIAFLSIAILIMLIAFINYFNFFMALIPRRIRAVNTEKVFGASLFRLRSSFILESMSLVLVSLFLAAMAVEGVRYTYIGDFISSTLAIDAHWNVALSVAGYGLLMAVVSSLYPAFYITSISPAFAIKGSFGNTVKGRRLRYFLLALQFVISISLISATFFIKLQYDYMMSFDMGFNKDNVLTFKIPSKVGKSYVERATFAENLQQNPQIVDVTFAQSQLVADARMTWGLSFDGKDVFFNAYVVHPNFLNFWEIPVVSGDGFQVSDALGNGAVIMNQSLCAEIGLPVDSVAWDRLMGLRNAGNCSDFFFRPLQKESGSFAFVANGVTGVQSHRVLSNVYVRLAPGGDRADVLRDIRSKVAEIDPTGSFSDDRIWTFEEELSRQYKDTDTLNDILTLFALISISISLLGVFGLVLFETQYRRREIAIRRVNGAGVGGIVGLFVKSYAGIVSICFLISIPITYILVGLWLSSFAYHINLFPWVFVVAYLIVLATTSLIVALRCRNAASENPVEALSKD